MGAHGMTSPWTRGLLTDDLLPLELLSGEVHAVEIAHHSQAHLVTAVQVETKSLQQNQILVIVVGDARVRSIMEVLTVDFILLPFWVTRFLMDGLNRWKVLVLALNRQGVLGGLEGLLLSLYECDSFNRGRLMRWKRS